MDRGIGMGCGSVLIAAAMGYALAGCSPADSDNPGTDSPHLVGYAGPTCAGEWGCETTGAQPDFTIVVEDEQYGQYVDSLGGKIQMIAFIIRGSTRGTFDLEDDPSRWPFEMIPMEFPGVTREGAATSIVIPHADFCARILSQPRGDELWFWYGEGQYALGPDPSAGMRRIVFVSPVPQWILCAMMPSTGS